VKARLDAGDETAPADVQVQNTPQLTVDLEHRNKRL